MFCYRDYQLTTRFNQQNEKSTSNYTTRIWVRGAALATKQTELCRSQLASILSAQRLSEYQGFIEKVGEIRFTKVKQRQLNKFNNLLNKKEGNITRVNSSPNLASQAGRCSPSPWEGSSLAASQAGLPGLPGSYFPSRHSPSPLGKEAT